MKKIRMVLDKLETNTISAPVVLGGESRRNEAWVKRLILIREKEQVKANQT